MNDHLVLTANGFMVRYDPERDVLRWTAVSPSGRIGDFPDGNQALQAVLDDQARRLCGYLMPGERMTIGGTVARLVYVIDEDKKQ